MKPRRHENSHRPARGEQANLGETQFHTLLPSQL
jgi:hypothetical protein